MNKISEFLRIKDASVYLGVCPNTLRNWVDDGKIQAFRHPMNRYRLFDRKKLDYLLKDFNKAFTQKKKIATPR
jgi:excisionase family DNA binding protein